MKEIIKIYNLAILSLAWFLLLLVDLIFVTFGIRSWAEQRTESDAFFKKILSSASKK